jgi:hypothetical protein
MSHPPPDTSRMKNIIIDHKHTAAQPNSGLINTLLQQGAATTSRPSTVSTVSRGGALESLLLRVLVPALQSPFCGGWMAPISTISD